MKRKWNHPEASGNSRSRTFRSIGQLEDTPQFRQWLDREFPQGAAEMASEEDRDVSRRSFMKFMGASTALAGFGLASCRRPVSKILPYADAPEWVIPGKPTFFATSHPKAGGAVPLYATTNEGRPTKLEPNALNPDASGTSGFTQASILDLYSPDRSKEVLYKGEKSSQADFLKNFKELAQAASAGGKVAFVFGEDESPTRNRLVKQFASQNGQAKFYRYEALAGENGAAALDQAFGPGVRVATDLSKAKRILSLDADFLGAEPVGKAKDFSANRTPDGADFTNDASHPDLESLNRLYCVEAAFSQTGGMADHRLRVAPSQVAKVAAAIANELGVAGVPAVEGSVSEMGGDFQKWVKACADDLKSHVGQSAVIVGGRQSPAVQQLGIAINEKLSNYGADKALKPVQTGLNAYGTLDQLGKDLASGAVEYLILCTPANPAYDAHFDFVKAVAEAPELKATIHFGLRSDATAHMADWHVPASHYLEQWNDTYTQSGTYCLVQPMILPLFGGYSELEVLAAFLDDEKTLVAGETEDGQPSLAYYAVRQTLGEVGGGDSEKLWSTVGREGFLAGTSYPAASGTASPKLNEVADAIVAEPTKDSLELVFQADYSVYDGRYINNGWLQEAPDPISKVTWDNVALISPQTAKDLGVYDVLVQLEPEESAFGIFPETTTSPVPQASADGPAKDYTGPMVTITVGDVNVEIAAQIGFGVADNTIILPVGYGQGFDEHHPLEFPTDFRSHVGQVGVNTGFDVYPLRRAAQQDLFIGGASLKKSDLDNYKLALTQEHHSMYGRALAREISSEKLSKDPAAAQMQGQDSHIPENQPLYKQRGSSLWTGEKAPDGGDPLLLGDQIHQWGMSVDLSSCTGCNACMIACQAENNIPIVGKTQVAMGREMHWIRMDRYFAEAEQDHKDEKNPAQNWIKANPAMITQPVACVQCEIAPCETVCPVNATVHTEEGLNAMAYNRCIGTRYCANNCPYKARRFNFFDYNKRNPILHKNLYKGPAGVKQVSDGKHLQRNPDVTVRMRGVMEKCTYCVQRLEKAKIKHKQTQKKKVELAGKPSHEVAIEKTDLRIPVDSVKVACQQACPTQAISFGNLLDGTKSKMVRAKASGRNYDLLKYLNTLPRTSFLARVKNPNKDMPDAAFIGHATVDMH